MASIPHRFWLPLLLAASAKSQQLSSVLTFLPCDNITLNLGDTGITEVSRIECSARCLQSGGCKGFMYNTSTCLLEDEAIFNETRVLAADGCFATKERIFQAQTMDYLNMMETGQPLRAPLHFQAVDTLSVSDIEDCLESCTGRTDGSCQGFYLAIDGVTCHVGSFETQISGQGVLVVDATQMFSMQQKAVAGFGCHPSHHMIPLHNTSTELNVLQNVGSHMACVHFCKFGIEPTCNYIEFVEDTKLCTLAHIPTERSFRVRYDPNYNADRVVCLFTELRANNFWPVGGTVVATPYGSGLTYELETLEDCVASTEVRQFESFAFNFETKTCKTGPLSTKGKPMWNSPNETEMVFIKKESTVPMMTEIKPALGQLPKMMSVANFTVSSEDWCSVTCFVRGQVGCTAYYLDATSMLCHLYLINLTSTDVMTVPSSLWRSPDEATLRCNRIFVNLTEMSVPAVSSGDMAGFANDSMRWSECHNWCILSRCNLYFVLDQKCYRHTLPYTQRMIGGPTEVCHSYEHTEWTNRFEILYQEHFGLANTTLHYIEAMPSFLAGEWNMMFCADTCEANIDSCNMAFFYEGMCHVGIHAPGPGPNVTEVMTTKSYNYYTIL